MDVSMIIAAVGDIVKTKGSSIAMVAVGPRPGRTPITVPMRLQTRAMARFRGWSATAKPWSRWSNMEGSLPEEREDAEREAHAEPDREGEVEDGAGRGIRGVLLGVLLGVVRAGRGAADEPPRPGEREREPEDGGERGRPGHPGHLVERGDRPGLPEVAEGHERDHEPLDARARHQSVRRRHCVLLGPRRGGAYLAKPSSLRSALHSGEASIFFTVSVQNWTASAGAPGAM